MHSLQPISTQCVQFAYSGSPGNTEVIYVDGQPSITVSNIR